MRHEHEDRHPPSHVHRRRRHHHRARSAAPAPTPAASARSSPRPPKPGASSSTRSRRSPRSATPSCSPSCSPTARAIKEDIYGKRLVLFAPLYISNLCENDCLYCAFRVRNKELKRRALTQDEIRHEIEILVDQGHKRVLLVAGESYPQQGFQYVLDSVATIYSVKRGNGEIRRVNVNVAPLTVDEFRALKATGIGTYQLFQETYHRETYAQGAPGRPQARLRLARHRHGPRHGGRHRRRRHRRAVRPVRLALRDPRHAAAHPPPRRDLRRGPAHDQHAAPRAGHRLRHRQPAAAPRLRPRLSQDRRHHCAWPCPTPA